ncbi:MAG: hypothetical protein GDA65_07520 [Nitrospira sp. CR1.1]|nr:hypothetical protein [Nitrospira sp. CR1.1]
MKHLVCALAILAASLLVDVNTSHAASLSGKWITSNGAEVECSETECKITKGKEVKGRGNTTGETIIKDFDGKEGKGTAKLQMIAKRKWVDATVEVGEDTLTLKMGKGKKGKEIAWKRAK